MKTSVAPHPEIVAFAAPIIAAIEQIIRCLDGQDAQGLNWRPPAAATNSLYVLATHMMGSAEWYLLDLLGAQSVARDRDAEFAAQGDSAGPLYARWEQLQPRLRDALDAMPPAMLGTPYQHPTLGPKTGREWLIFIAQHAAEHAGHAELTRDLLKAARG